MTTLDSVPSALAQGVACIIMERVDEDFPPTRNSNLRQAPASRDIPCTSSSLGDDVEQLPSLASVGLQARQIAGQYYRYFGFHFLVVLSFFESLMIGLAPMPPWFCSRYYCFGLPTSVPVLGRVTDTIAGETHHYRWWCVLLPYFID